MKKYKLIKDLPFMKKGTIYFKDVESKYVKDKTSYLPDVTGMKHERFAIHSDWVEDNPKFWEEIEEKDYEILTVTPNNKNTIYKPLKEIRPYEGDGLSPHWQIHSIKRLSDGEIFTLGDKIKNHKESITEISLDDEDETRMIPWLKTHKENENGIALNYAEKYKTPLFTTEDGVDIYKGDDLYIVSGYFTIIEWENAVKEGIKEDEIYFSTKKGAEEYILWNKPVLTLKDVASIYPGINKNHPDTPSHQAERIKELVKSKL